MGCMCGGVFDACCVGVAAGVARAKARARAKAEPAPEPERGASSRCRRRCAAGQGSFNRRLLAVGVLLLLAAFAAWASAHARSHKSGSPKAPQRSARTKRNDHPLAPKP